MTRVTLVNLDALAPLLEVDTLVTIVAELAKASVTVPGIDGEKLETVTRPFLAHAIKHLGEKEATARVHKRIDELA